MFTQEEKNKIERVTAHAHTKHAKLISEMSKISFIYKYDINVWDETIRFGLGFEVGNHHLKEMFELCNKHGFNVIANNGIWLSKYI